MFLPATAFVAGGTIEDRSERMFDDRLRVGAIVRQLGCVDTGAQLPLYNASVAGSDCYPCYDRFLGDIGRVAESGDEGEGRIEQVQDMRFRLEQRWVRSERSVARDYVPGKIVERAAVSLLH